MGKAELLLLFIQSCRENKPEKLRAFLTLAKDLEIDINAGDPDHGRTGATAAVIGGSLRCIEILAKEENYESWNIPDRYGYTPLTAAIRDEKFEILKLLLNCPRVDLNQKDSKGNSPVMHAIKKEKTAVAMLMIKSPRVDLRTKDKNGSSLQRIARWE